MQAVVASSEESQEFSQDGDESPLRKIEWTNFGNEWWEKGGRRSEQQYFRCLGVQRRGRFGLEKWKQFQVNSNKKIKIVQKTGKTSRSLLLIISTYIQKCWQISKNNFKAFFSCQTSTWPCSETATDDFRFCETCFCPSCYCLLFCSS